MPPRRFSIQEANDLLPQLSALLSDLKNKKAEMQDLQAQLQEVALQASRNGHGLEGRLQIMNDKAGRLSDELKRLIEQVNETGCELKDIDQGLVDFRAIHLDREVYLCWRLGELRIEWWHELDSGFSGRRPLGKLA